jgi:hypothetical protein
MSDPIRYRTPPNIGGPPIGVGRFMNLPIRPEFPSLNGLQPSSPLFDINQLPEEDQFLQKKTDLKGLDRKTSKVTQATKLLEEILEDTSDFSLQGPILDGIKHLEYIMKALQNPQIVGKSNPDIQTTQLSQIQLEIAKINAKVDQFLENSNPGKPTYAEALQNQQVWTLKGQPNSQLNPQPGPLSPMVVIPKRKDVQEDDYPMDSSPGPGPRSRSSPSPNQSPTRAMPRAYPGPTQPGDQPTRARRLILKAPMDFLDRLNPMKLRDQINDQLSKHGFHEPVVATINRSVSNLSLVITTMEAYSSAFLLAQKTLWEKFIPYTSLHHDSKWARLIIHTVPTRPFQMDEGEALIKSEIETFNPQLKLMRNPIWLSKEESRTQKTHSSILIYLENQDVAQKALNSRVILAGVSCRAERFIPRHTQCDKCQKFGHTRPYCKGDIKCRICAQNHEDKDHRCQICQVSNQECPHSIATCSNCGLSHASDDRKCKEWEKVRPRFTRPRSTENNPETMEIDDL